MKNQHVRKCPKKVVLCSFSEKCFRTQTSQIFIPDRSTCRNLNKPYRLFKNKTKNIEWFNSTWRDQRWAVLRLRLYCIKQQYSMMSTRLKTNCIKLFLRWKHEAPGCGGPRQQAVNVDAVIKAANVEQTASSWKKSALACQSGHQLGFSLC